MNSPLASPPPFTVDTLAARWCCSPGAVRNRIRAGEIRTFRIGVLIRIPAAEVERIECVDAAAAGVGNAISAAHGQKRR